MIIKTSNLTKLVIIVGLFALSIVALNIVLPTKKAEAVSASDWRAGRIIDDAVFYNKDSMSLTQIQDFLNAKVPVCDRWNQTRFTYAGQPYGPPYTCLKEYQENPTTHENNIGRFNPDGSPYNVPGGWSAAQIIKDAALAYNINPQALIVLLQKETAIVTDPWSAGWQFDRAMGYACPDSGPNGTANCNSSYYGFYNQVGNAAWQLKTYKDCADGCEYNPATGKYRYGPYNFKAGVTRNILWQVGGVCGSSPVYLENSATAALYNYTPYQPNQAALNNLYGTGDGCSAYGNRNFWRIFNDWFGSTVNGEHFWRIIKAPGDSRLFLQVGNTKRWIPTSQLYTDWKLDQYSSSEISLNEFNDIPTIPELTRLGTTGQYNYIVEGGRKHYLPNQYLNLWGYQNKIAAPVNTLLASITENEPMGRFIKATDGSFWLINGQLKHPLSSQNIYAWGYSANNTVGLTSSYLSEIPTGAEATRYINFSGYDYLIDQGGLVKMSSSQVAQAWQPAGYLNIPSLAASVMPVRPQAGWLVKATDSPHWYFIDNGKKRYIPNTNISVNWGVSSNTIIQVSPEVLASMPNATTLSSIVKNTDNGNWYLLDGKKHLVGSPTLLKTLAVNQSGINEVTSQRLDIITSGTDYTKPLVLVNGTPHLYVLDNGKKYHVSSGELSGAYNAWNGYQQLASTLIDTIPLSSDPLDSLVKDTLGQHYLIDNGTKILINNPVLSAWSKASTLPLSDEIISLIPSSQTTISSRYIKIFNNTYVMNNGKKTLVNPSLMGSYVGSAMAFEQTNNTIASNLVTASFLLKSKDDQKVWLINKGARTEVNFSEQVTYGYLSSNTQIAEVNNDFLASFPIEINNSLLIRKQGSWGIKFINFGHSLGFNDGNTISSIVSADNPIVVVDDWTYDQFPLLGTITRIIKDDSGKLYLLENGQKRWITNGGAAYSPYKDIPITYLYGTTMWLIPNGPAIN